MEQVIHDVEVNSYTAVPPEGSSVTPLKSLRVEQLCNCLPLHHACFITFYIITLGLIFLLYILRLSICHALCSICININDCLILNDKAFIDSSEHMTLLIHMEWWGKKIAQHVTALSMGKFRTKVLHRKKQASKKVKCNEKKRSLL